MKLLIHHSVVVFVGLFAGGDPLSILLLIIWKKKLAVINRHFLKSDSYLSEFYCLPIKSLMKKAENPRMMSLLSLLRTKGLIFLHLSISQVRLIQHQEFGRKQFSEISVKPELDIFVHNLLSNFNLQKKGHCHQFTKVNDINKQ